ncbi:hypothetical protein SPRG_01538, partial [Saprolegnia parasitica CBS 223.65]
MPMDGKHTTRAGASVIRGNACTLWNGAMPLVDRIKRQPIRGVDAGSASASTRPSPWRRESAVRRGAAEGPRHERVGRQCDVDTQHPIVWLHHFLLDRGGNSRSRSFSLPLGRRMHEPYRAWECTSFS